MESLPLDALIVAFGFANVMAAIPILPGGLGVVEGTYLAVLVWFGVPKRVVVPAVAAYRSAQYLMPIALGALAYASLRVGPWKIERRDRLIRLRDLARVETAKGESRIDFALRFQRESGAIVDEEHPPPGHAPTGQAPLGHMPPVHRRRPRAGRVAVEEHRTRSPRATSPDRTPARSDFPPGL